MSLRALLLAIILLAGAAMAASPQKSAAALGKAGWDAIQSGQPQVALGSFSDAIALSPRDPRLHLGAGLAAHLLGQETKAIEALERALALDARLTAASLLLGSIAYALGDFEKAIGTYERALALAPENVEIKGKLERWRKEAELQGGFRQTLGAHFTVLFEGPAEEELAAKAVELLEAAYWRVGTSLYSYPSRIIKVVLYTREQFSDITRSPSWSAGSFDGTIRVPMRGALDSPRELERVLTHEFTHALVRSLAAQGVPTWLNEGLAVMFEPGDLAWAEREVKRATSRIPLKELHTTFRRFSAGQAKLAYAESALAARALVDRAGASSVNVLLTDLGDGHPFAEAFERRLLFSYEEFQRTWDEALR